MGRPHRAVPRLALFGTLSVVLGVTMLGVGTFVGASSTPAFADTTPYELYCPGTPVGNLVLNDVVSTGALTPENPSGAPFGVDGFQVKFTLPASVVSALQALGASAFTGSLSLPVTAAVGVQPPSVTAGPFSFDVSLPSSAPGGLAVAIPPAPTTFGGFFATPFTVAPENTVPPSNVSVTLGPPTITLDLTGTPVAVTCSAFANDTIAASGITTQTPTGSTIAPLLSHSTPGPPNIGPGPYYLALGDSVPMWNGGSSYPFEIADHYAPTDDNALEVMDLACSGETTASMLSGPTCAPSPYTSQMQEALAFLQQHQSGLALITIDIGGNDVVSCVTSTGIDQQCVTNAVATMTTNLQSILTQLRQAAGPVVPIVAMNYFDPFLGDWLAGGAVQTAAIQTVAALTTFNSDLAEVYGQFHVQVADVFGAFQTSDLTDTVSSPWGVVPVAVNDACTWLDIACTAGQVEGFGDDPNDAGAKVIAQAFEQVIGPSIPTPTTTSTTGSTTTSSTTSTTTSSTTSTTSSTTTTTTPSTPTTTSTTTSTTSPHSTTSSTAALSSNGAGSTTSAPPRVVTAPSSSLAFTGSGPGLQITTLIGALAVLVGLAALLLADVPRLVVRRLAALAVPALARQAADGISRAGRTVLHAMAERARWFLGR